MKKLVLFCLSMICLASMSFAQNSNCQNVVNLNTGYNHTSLATYSVGSYDNYWAVISGPTTGACGPYAYPSPASVISPSWGATNLYPSTQWLSFRSTASLSCNNTCATGQLPVVFERKFCLVKPDTVVINTKMRFDNAACLFVDGTATGTGGINVPLSTVMGSTPVAFGGSIPTAGCQACDNWNDTKTFDGNHDTKAINFKIYLTPGTHNIQIRVRNNSAILFGVMLTGTVTGMTQQNNFLCPNDCQVTNSIAIQKILDKNCDGKNDAGDAIGTGWQFNVTGPGGFNKTVTTDITGYAFLTGLTAGTYTATEIQQAGWTTSTPIKTITVANNQTSSVTFFNCPKPCISIAQLQVNCGPINAAGVQTYTVSGLISNGNNSTVNVSATTSPGSISGFSPATLPPSATNQPFSFVYTKGANNTLCYVIKLTDLNGNSCLKDTCVTLPQCPTQCLDLTYTLKCNPSITPNTPQPYVYMVMITNPTTSTINIPMASSTGVLSPSIINAAPGTNTYNVYYTPNAGTSKACIVFGVGIVPLPIPLCTTPKECIPLPNCCLDADGKLSCGAIVNGIQTYNFTGSVINYGSATALGSGLGISSNATGGISGFTPSTGIPANASALISFTFTPTGTMPSSICFYFAPTKTSKACDSVCVQVPVCPKPCIDVTKLDAKCETINGVKTIVVTGMLNTSTTVITSLNINPQNAGTTTVTTGGTIPANATGHNFTFQYVPTAYSATYCFVFSPTHPVIDYKLCKDTFCVKNPCSPATDNKCCPTTKMIACCVNSNEIKYEFTAAALPASICGIILTVTPAAGVLGGNIYKPAFVTGPINITGTTTFSSVAAGSTLTYYLTIPATNTSNVTIKYITCAGDTCGTEKFTIGKNPIPTGGTVVLTGTPIKDSLFASSFKLQLGNFIGKPRIKSISVVADDNGSTQNVFFAITGAEQNGSENKALIPLTASLQGNSAATFIFKDGIDSENYKGQLLNIVTTRRVKTFKVLIFDEEGLLITTSSFAGSLQPISSTASKELKSNISSLSIAPNPATEEVSLNFILQESQNISIDLMNLNGQVLKHLDNSFHNANQAQNIKFSVSDLPSGIYLVRMTNAQGQSFTEKLSVVH
jgi:hypothetical protein